MNNLQFVLTAPPYVKICKVEVQHIGDNFPCTEMVDETIPFDQYDEVKHPVTPLNSRYQHNLTCPCSRTVSCQRTCPWSGAAAATPCT